MLCRYNEVPLEQSSYLQDYTVDTFLIRWQKHIVVSLFDAYNNDSCPTVQSRNEPPSRFLAGKGGRYFSPTDSSKLLRITYGKHNAEPSLSEIVATFAKRRETVHFDDTYNCSNLCVALYVGNTFRQLGNGLKV